MSQQKEQWGSRLGVILAVAGSAVGLGNFLRFPGQAAQNGGGAFMIPYFIALVLVAIPIMWAEWAMGRFGGRSGFHSAPAIFGVLGGKRGFRYVGVLGLLIPISIYMYYVLIEAWCLGYAWNFLVGGIDLGTDPNQYAEKSGEFFNQFVGAGADGAVFESGGQSLLFFAMITFVLNFVLIFRGVSKGIESFCIKAMPIMAICAGIVLIRVLTLGTPNADIPEQNVVNGLGYMWNPRMADAEGPWYQALMNSQTWLAATGQIFFSMSVGFGIIINYSSYLKRNDDVILSGLTAASTNEFFEVCLGGLITIPAAFIFLGVAGAGLGTFGLGFNTLPCVFKYMEFGRFFGFIWFFMLFLAAITSSLSMLQPAIAFLEEGLGIGRRASVTILGLITLMGASFILYFSKGMAALDTIDFWVGTFFIYILATLEVLLFAWIFGVKRGYEEAMRGAEMKIPKIWMFVIKFVSPVYLLVIFYFWCKGALPNYVETMKSQQVPKLAIALVLSVTVFLVILIYLAGKRWNAIEERRAAATE
ncbi:MAG: sodium-dependent transporter [Planctomycetota bacterium]|jgi:SNF family Na+-dependent transporter